MLNSIIAPIATWIIGVISAASYFGVAGVMAAKSACIPLPVAAHNDVQPDAQ